MQEMMNNIQNRPPFETSPQGKEVLWYSKKEGPFIYSFIDSFIYSFNESMNQSGSQPLNLSTNQPINS